MTHRDPLNLAIAMPEMFLAAAALCLLMFGVFTAKEKAFRTVSFIAVIALLVTLVLAARSGQDIGFFGQYISDDFAAFTKVLILLSSAVAILMTVDYAEREKMDRFEFPVLISLSAVGMMMMVSANDLLSLYLGLELQSLALYVVAALRRDTVKSSESGLKYFVLGSIASGMILYGMSMVYGFSGTTNFDALATRLSDGEALSVGLVIGMVFMIAGLCFKISAVPFHMWTPDVYEGAPTPVTAFFAVAPKIAGLALFVRVAVGPFGGVAESWQQIVVLVAILSMALGSVAAIWQSNIKRMMAYSSIGHVGFALVGLAAGTEAGVEGVLVYLGVYMVMNIGTFAAILSMKRNGRMVEEINDLAGLAKTDKLMALVVLILMFSMAGIPPLAGFFSKLFVFKAAVEAGLVVFAALGVVFSVISAYYYLRVIKVMYFDEAQENFDAVSVRMRTIMSVSGLAMVLFVIYQGPLLSGAAAAASALFGTETVLVR